MSLGKKIFLAVFFVSILLSGAIATISYLILKRSLSDSYQAQYQKTTEVLARSLTEIEAKTESLMFLAAQSVREEYKDRLPSEAELLVARDKLGVSHFFIIDRDGKFIRSTNEEPSLIPNLFSFCDDYRKLLSGESEVEVTPIIPPFPEPKPYKFLILPSAKRDYLIEVGVKIDFLSQTLDSIMRSDKNLVSLNLFTPSGIALGSAGSADHVKSEPLMVLSTEVESSQVKCCQCDVAGISAGGEYFYNVQAEVSRAELTAQLNKILIWVLTLFFSSGVAAFILAKVLTAHLISRINRVKTRLEMMKREPDKTERINLTGNDEIAYLADHFDKLLDKLESFQDRFTEVEKRAAVSAIIEQVSHDIRSPLAALKMSIESLRTSGVNEWINLKRATLRISEILNVLSTSIQKEHDEDSNTSKSESVRLELRNICGDILEVVEEKRVRYSHLPHIKLIFSPQETDLGLFSSYNPCDFKRCLSNAINNSVEAVKDQRGFVKIMLEDLGDSAAILVTDSGQGIPADKLSLVFDKNFTWGKESGTGLGLFFLKSCVESWGGSVSISSSKSGTCLIMELNKADVPSWFVSEVEILEGSKIVVIDDEESIFNLWEQRLGQEGPTDVPIIWFSSVDQFESYLASHINSSATYFVDHNIAGSHLSGAELIVKYGLSNKAFLVTSVDDKPELYEFMREHHIRLIPKDWIRWTRLRLKRTDPGEQVTHS